MNVPNEFWYALGGLVLAWIAQRLKIPWPSKKPLPTDTRSVIREILMELLKPPTKAPDEAELRERFREFLREPAETA